MKKTTHYVVSRKINEGILIDSIGLKLIVKRVTKNRAILYINAPEDLRIERVMDRVFEATPESGTKDGPLSNKKL